jgi:hypothetical protein
MASVVIYQCIDKISSTPATKELIRVRALALREGLGWLDASTLEQSLIDAVVLAWLRWTLTEA